MNSGAQWLLPAATNERVELPRRRLPSPCPTSPAKHTAAAFWKHVCARTGTEVRGPGELQWRVYFWQHVRTRSRSAYRVSLASTALEGAERKRHAVRAQAGCGGCSHDDEAACPTLRRWEAGLPAAVSEGLQCGCNWPAPPDGWMRCVDCQPISRRRTSCRGWLHLAGGRLAICAAHKASDRPCARVVDGQVLRVSAAWHIRSRLKSRYRSLHCT